MQNRVGGFRARGYIATVGCIGSLTFALAGCGSSRATEPLGTGGSMVAGAGGGGMGGAGGGGAGGTGGAIGVAGSFGVIVPVEDSGSAGSAGTGQPPPESWPPTGFTNVTASTVGAYALGPERTAAADPTATVDAGAAVPGRDGGSVAQCGGLFALVRDFKMGDRGGHPDFETGAHDDRGIVAPDLGADGKPVYALAAGGTRTTSGKSNFDQWYHDVPGVNRTFVLGLHLIAQGGVVTFQADQFFPLDGQGFGNEEERHNYSFTSEIHTSFTYNGGESFTFIGDDDVFVFINHHLVIDLGGIHTAQTGQVSLDTVGAQLGLTKGKVYDLSVFHAERHTSESHFRIDTNLALIDCGQLPPDTHVN